MTWSARGYRPVIDYILTNKKLSPLVNETKVFRRYDVTTDHYLLIFQNPFTSKMVYIYQKISTTRRKFWGTFVRGPKYKITLSEEIRAKYDVLTTQMWNGKI